MTQEDFEEWMYYTLFAKTLIDSGYPVPTENIEQLAEILKRKDNDKKTIQARTD
jgi:hypothetical protein